MQAWILMSAMNFAASLGLFLEPDRIRRVCLIWNLEKAKSPNDSIQTVLLQNLLRPDCYISKYHPWQQLHMPARFSGLSRPTYVVCALCERDWVLFLRPKSRRLRSSLVLFCWPRSTEHYLIAFAGGLSPPRNSTIIRIGTILFIDLMTLNKARHFFRAPLATTPTHPKTPFLLKVVR